MAQTKFQAGDVFPEIALPSVGGGKVTLGKPKNGHDWQMVVVYRGKHCPLCVGYLEKLEALKQQFFDIGVDLLVVSGDPQAKAEVGYDLSIADMKKLGLYISHPRPQETDRPFAEPGIFVINQDGKLQVTDISNAPFSRPDLEVCVSGLKFIRDPANNYPIRGTYE
jgi:peroxiredoxin